jgi:pyruvate formate lyase activating enzyme
LGTVGCNLACEFCQNHELSRGSFDARLGIELSPGRAVLAAQTSGCESIAYTYNEPTVFAEYAEATASLAAKAGLRNVFVTNGYVTQEALPGVYANIDAANVDLKAFSDDFYRKWTGADLQPVLEAIVELRRRGVWVELTNLLIPGLNDAEADLTRMCQWILTELGERVPLHFSAFHPDYRLRDRPSTPARTLSRARQLAREVGLRHVYVGNVHDEEGSSTYCAACGGRIVARSWHAIRDRQLKGSRCGHCGEEVDGILT